MVRAVDHLPGGCQHVIRAASTGHPADWLRGQPGRCHQPSPTRDRNVKLVHGLRGPCPWAVRACGPRPWPSVKQPTVRTDRPGGTGGAPLKRIVEKVVTDSAAFAVHRGRFHRPLPFRPAHDSYPVPSLYRGDADAGDLPHSRAQHLADFLARRIGRDVWCRWPMNRCMTSRPVGSREVRCPVIEGSAGVGSRASR